MISMFVIYDHPIDYPNHYVVREWIGVFPRKECDLFKSLETAREFLKSKNLVRVDRRPEDDVNILEIWL